MKTVTRFAPSPSGDLHLGGARTALFNYLYAKSNNGDFRIRIEDTDNERNKKEAVKSILNGLEWLNIKADKKIIFQSENFTNHLNFAESLICKGIAYKCFDENEQTKPLKNKNIKFRSKWRNVHEKKYPKNKKFTIRLKIPDNYEIKINDLVQGKVVVNSNEVDDYILVRSNRTPTFLLASVVDDISMGVTDIIRGDDHLTNTFRQFFLYKMSQTKLPNFAHIPLILNEKGEKLSKRDNVPSLIDFKQKGYLSQAIVNYLLRLGWSYGNKEILDLDFSKKVFSIKDVGKSPSKIDKKKIDFLNQFYLKEVSVKKIYSDLNKLLAEKNQEFINGIDVNLLKFLPDYVERSVTINDLYKQLNFLIKDQNYLNKEKQKIPKINIENKKILNDLEKVKNWNLENIKKCLTNFIKMNNLNFKEIGIPLRLILTGTTDSPSIYNVMALLGKKEVLNRLKKLW